MRRLSSPAQPWVMSISEASFHFQHVPGLLLKGGLLLGFYVAAGIKKKMGSRLTWLHLKTMIYTAINTCSGLFSLSVSPLSPSCTQSLTLSPLLTG